MRMYHPDAFYLFCVVSDVYGKQPFGKIAVKPLFLVAVTGHVHRPLHGEQYRKQPLAIFVPLVLSRYEHIAEVCVFSPEHFVESIDVIGVQSLHGLAQ